MAFYKQILNLDIENSSICNARCPQCIRESRAGDYTWFDQTYLTTDFFNRIPDDVYLGLRKILFSGTMGDPCAAPNFLDVVRLVRSKNPNMLIKISTNGGMKDETFWQELVSVLGNNHEVTFAIDGLEDTNHIYRVNVSWNKVMRNSKAFISSGGYAAWQFIVFKHNEHQVEIAEHLSKQLGFKNFFARPSHRFAADQVLNKTTVGAEGVLIQPPTKQKYVHVVLRNPTRSSFSQWLKESEHVPIECYAQYDSSLYIDSTGRVFPCCYLAAGMYNRHGLDLPDRWDDLYAQAGSHCNLYTAVWNEIIHSDFFEQIQSSWAKPTYDQGRLVGCAATCGKFQGRINDPKASV